MPFEKDNLKNFFANEKFRNMFFREFAKFLQNSPNEIFQGKLETYLTCFAVSSYLKEKFLDDETGSLFEEYSLCAIEKTLCNETPAADVQLLMKEMSKILALPYPVVNKIRLRCINWIYINKEFMKSFTVNTDKLYLWEKILDWDHQARLLEVFNNYNHK